MIIEVAINSLIMIAAFVIVAYVMIEAAVKLDKVMLARANKETVPHRRALVLFAAALLLCILPGVMLGISIVQLLNPIVPLAAKGCTGVLMSLGNAGLLLLLHMLYRVVQQRKRERMS